MNLSKINKLISYNLIKKIYYKFFKYYFKNNKGIYLKHKEYNLLKILDKINLHGFDALSEEEKNVLKKASEE